MWYSSFWSERPKNHRNLKILVSNFVPRGFEARRTWGFEAQHHGVSRGGAGVSRHSAMGFRGTAPWGSRGGALIKHFSDLSFCAVPWGPIWSEDPSVKVFERVKKNFHFQQWSWKEWSQRTYSTSVRKALWTKTSRCTRTRKEPCGPSKVIVLFFIFHQKSNNKWAVFSFDFFVFPKTATKIGRFYCWDSEIGVEELLKNASVEDFVETARSLSLEQYDGSTPFEGHPEIVEVINWSGPFSRLSTYLYFLV